MKKFFSIVLAVALLLCSVSALAEWPERTIELIVPANPGGDTDANARAIQQALQEEMGWNVIVTNMSGGSGSVALNDCLANSDGGHRFVVYHSGAAVSEVCGMYEDFNVAEDFKFCGMPIMDYSNAFVINSANPNFTDVPSMVEYMQANPGAVSFATEMGSFTHLHVLAFQAAAGVTFNIVNAGTAADKVNALLGKELDVIGTQAGLVRDYLSTLGGNGEFSCLGVLADERLAGAPEIPTLKEQGYDVEFSKFFYLVAPSDVDDAVVTAMNEALAKVAENEGFKAYCESALLNPCTMTPEETKTYFVDQEAYYAELLGA